MSLAPDLFRALGALCEPPDRAHPRLAAALGLPGAADAESHTEAFVLQLVPYASVYLGPEGMLGGAARDRIAGFWRALRLTPPAEPDHLAALLGLYASLVERERDESEPARSRMWRHARRTLLAEHLITWVPAYASAMVSLGSTYHAGWAKLLNEALASEAGDLGALDGTAHLRDIPALPSPETDGFVRALLAPARSGLIITRDDLARCARMTGLGLRVGERAFALRSLIDQDPVAAYDWLAGAAATSRREYHATTWPVPAAAARHWLSRARATHAALTTVLTRLRGTAPEVAHATGS
ncbi:MAG TPA: molecular chaperone TorD family protein [Streptosporangiaceae bacterium]|nr:molecular chaperone TorD family protein [Streptosporangiaceae bacterium]